MFKYHWFKQLQSAVEWHGTYPLQRISKTWKYCICDHQASGERLVSDVKTENLLKTPPPKPKRLHRRTPPIPSDAAVVATEASPTTQESTETEERSQVSNQAPPLSSPVGKVYNNYYSVTWQCRSGIAEVTTTNHYGQKIDQEVP